MTIDVRSLTGDEIKPVLPELARLRITVFRDWPYLYDGTLEYEEGYLEKLAKAKGAVASSPATATRSSARRPPRRWSSTPTSSASRSDVPATTSRRSSIAGNPCC